MRTSKGKRREGKRNEVVVEEKKDNKETWRGKDEEKNSE